MYIELLKFEVLNCCKILEIQKLGFNTSKDFCFHILMKKIIILLFTILLVNFEMSAQALKISDKPDEFITDVPNVMAATGMPQAETIGKNLQTLWTNGKFSNDQKTKLASISNLMLKKGYKPMPHFLALFDAVNQGAMVANLSGANMDSYLETLKKTIESSDSKTVIRYIDITRTYFTDRRLYFSNYNRLYLFQNSVGTVSFKYNDQKTEVNKPVAPAGTPAPEPVKKNDFDDWDTPVGAANNAQVPTDEAIPQFINPGPAMEFKGVNLTIATGNDSVTLVNTTGILGMKDGILLGTGGTFSWEVVGQPEVFVTLGNFRMDIKNPKLTSDEATMTHTGKLNTPVKGVFEFLSKKRPKTAPMTYPRFMSLKDDVVLKNSADIEYKGGFSMSGRSVFSTAVNAKVATIGIKKDGKVILKTSSRRFVLGDSLLTAPTASLTAYIANGDSLYHPSVKFVYNRKTFALRSNKVDDGGFKETSYSDSYHKLNIKADAMKWNLNDQKMDFYILSGKNVVPALFESFDYFNQERFNNIASQNSFNPLIVVANFCRKNNVPTTTVSEIARTFQKDANQIRSSFLDVMQKGYLEYDPDVEVLKISRKGQHYLAVQYSKKDYDNFLIPSFFSSNSKDSTSNATLNLKDNQLIIRGVKQFYLSDSLNVYMAPYDNTIRVNKDRNFGISGELKTGNFRFRGKELSFNYSDFSVKLDKIDSITFIPQKELSKRGRTEIGGDLKYESGTIFINKPDNKSGRQRMPEYPRLVVPTGVTAYFDHPYRAAGAYNKKIFFKVPNIDFDSLNVKDIDFVGTFNSDGIFPPFKETLISMPDNTLGFSHKAPEGKYPLYNGKSFMKFANFLLMDKTGLHAEGDLNHLTAQIQAKDAIFTPDTVIAYGTTGIINEGTVGAAYFTKVDIKNYSLKWKPKVDSMLIETRGNTFDFYAASSKLEGKLLVRQTGMFGFGKIRRSDSETDSEHFKFLKDAFDAEPADNLMVGNNLKTAKPALLGKNMNVLFNLATGLVSIKTPANTKLDDSTSLYFPYTAYKTSINSAEWDINKKTITMKGDVRNTTFTSMESSQEGLAFNGSDALYEIEKQSLNINGVPFVKSADAKIFPEKGFVSIRRDAEMRAFYNAKLQVDTLTGYHNLVNGNIRIISRLKFEGDASYRFVNTIGDTIKIKMGNFEFRESIANDKKKTKGYMTVAKAVIEQNDKFHISQKLLYKGDITMLASEQNLRMDGFIKPESKSRTDAVNWIAYKGNSTDNINIKIEPNLRSDLNTPLFVGLHSRTASSGLYSTFLSDKENGKDEDVFMASGLLKDINKSTKFEISADDKVKSLETNRFVYEDDKKLLNLEGKFNFFANADYIQSAGAAEIHLDSSRYKFDQMLVVNFPTPPEVLKAMADKIIKVNLEGRSTESADESEDKDLLVSKLANILGSKAIEPFEKRIRNEHVVLPTLNPKLNTTMVISKANLRWSDQHSSYYSVGKISVSSIGTNDINAAIDGFLEIKKTVDGDEFYIYLNPSDDVWYLMSYIRGEMGAVSSDNDFNAIVSTKAKAVKKGTGKNAYNFISVGAEEKISFTDRFQDSYRTRTEKGKKVVKKEDPKKEVKKKEETKEGF
jgi:hypothetical protein